VGVTTFSKPFSLAHLDDQLEKRFMEYAKAAASSRRYQVADGAEYWKAGAPSTDPPAALPRKCLTIYSFMTRPPFEKRRRHVEPNSHPCQPARRSSGRSGTHGSSRTLTMFMPPCEDSSPFAFRAWARNQDLRVRLHAPSPPGDVRRR
jgi:hypothetical protein